MDTFDFRQDLLDIAKELTLADLLDCPVTQFWMISALSNSVINVEHFTPHETPKDEEIELKIVQIMNRVPYKTRRTVFDSCRKMIIQRREQQRDTFDRIQQQREEAEAAKTEQEVAA